MLTSAPPQLHRRVVPATPGRAAAIPHVLDEPLFRSALRRERKRADRSNQPLVVLLARLEGARVCTADGRRGVVAALLAVCESPQVVGWFSQGKTIGLIAAEVNGPLQVFTKSLEWRFRGELEEQVGAAAAGGVVVAVHAHPQAIQRATAGLSPVDPLLAEEQVQPSYDRVKRVLDVAASLLILLILSPLMLAIALLVKLTSPGPVLFRQTRVGQGMRPFKMLKFRTMHVNNDSAVHHQFVTSFIKAGAQAQATAQNGMFKIKNDPRVTSIGRILRKTSLDELPQLWNVVRGEMSLVGPRPPLGYEVDEYQAWHCRRVLEAKPGITGLWQVMGRSRTTFDEMVRLDLRYARGRSLWTDVKILLATPAAVIVGKGAA